MTLFTLCVIVLTLATLGFVTLKAAALATGLTAVLLLACAVYNRLAYAWFLSDI